MNTKRIIWGILLIAVGALMIARVYGYVEWIDLIELRKICIPVLFIIIGINLLFSRKTEKKSDSRHTHDNLTYMEPSRTCSVVLSGKRMDFSGQSFEGINIKALLGGVELDLRGADIKDGSVIRISTCMGGVSVLFPPAVGVEIDSNCIMGGVEDNLKAKGFQCDKTIIIDAQCMMGGVELK